MNFEHRPVLLKEAVNSLLKKEQKIHMFSSRDHDPISGIFIDGTFGRGGHTQELLSFLDDSSKILVFDKDPEAIEFARKMSEKDNRIEAIHSSFANIKDEVFHRNISCVDGILLDLGVSSPQLDDGSRGFSFLKEGPLDMRMDPTKGISVAEWLSIASVDEIREVILNYGEERFAFKIAKAIVARREKKAFTTTLDLAECISSVIPKKKNGKHPATRSFQALRIYINNELFDLSKGITSAIEILKPGGVLVTISFHSLEDRIIKNIITFDESKKSIYAGLPLLQKDLPVPKVRQVLKILPDESEVSRNPRARSAVLRVAQKSFL
ncbi:16S rRNA (cytosine(1402)-N(4))-methyltransferase RsmH [Candidatus Kinetoplastidibacterium crithidiae]|uniref:Ribosomal RNA small subunit methyltransferase H n=1 Tax=Candidatus Kinetoplastidibacterium crithidiae TCC036E TaxID=1208918 RepID=M1LQI3_9PROT|nr:16S rRNA (cytosine(1402)-N(4))-methyltransferase RsmH [Candidatus Kinetoplastibacterium crithidii]AFZ82482.1 16S rRNA (cytosine1402-N4)-methyltransferase [Candidatus Kinetoplastibacterium crithidii (ex Angomonas deanei ATCC 30255)]AGF47857.1 S-adenosyl-methyltransferase [Candidatus Kinetoplastibacterium crithidii TCC036E]